MTQHKYPKETRSRAEFFERLGFDPNTVSRDGTNEAGFRQHVLTDDGKRQLDPAHPDYLLMKLTPWPNGEADFWEYREAETEDLARVYDE